MRSLILIVLLAGVALADDPGARKAAEKHFRIGEKAYARQNFAAAAEAFEEAYKILPIPDLAFSAAQAHRRQYRVDRKLERAHRAVELYRRYLDSVKTGGHVGAAADGLDAMERELSRHGGGKIAAGPAAVERTTLIVNPELATERVGQGVFEISEVSDAELANMIVLVDGKPAAAYEKLDVEPGPHKIRVEVEGYLIAEVTERAVKGENTTASIPLQPRPARVTIETEAGARIRVDGRAAGTGPRLELDLPAGRHVINIARKGRTSVARELTVKRGEKVTVDEPLEKTTRRKAVPWVAAGAGAFGVLAVTATIGAFVYDGRASDKLATLERDGDGDAGDVSDYDLYRERRDRLTTTALVTGGLALLVGGAAFALYTFDTPGDAELRIAPAASPTGAGLVLGGRF